MTMKMMAMMTMKILMMMMTMTTISKEQVLTLVARLGATRFCREPTQATTCHPSICCSCHGDDDYDDNDDDNDHH